MNPCNHNKETLALLALDALEDATAQGLRAHLEHCPGCSEYWMDLTSIRRDHEEAAGSAPIPALSPGFHGRLQTRLIEDANQRHSLRRVSAWLFDALLSSRAAVAVATSLMAILGVWLWRGGAPSHINTEPPIVRGADPTGVPPGLIPPPSLSAYRFASNQSLEALDDLLARQGAATPSSLGSLAVGAFTRSEGEL